jgi:hypothetical protein
LNLQVPLETIAPLLFNHILMYNAVMNRTLILIAMCFVCSCSMPKSEKKYVVVDSFSQIVYETNDKNEAFDRAQKLTLFGRVFASKPDYFVLEANK